MAKLFGIIGDPVENSLSPAIHRLFFDQCGIDAEYRRFPAKKEELRERLRELRERNISGFNVTHPHKQAVIEFLDDIDLPAKEAGAVNTVVCKGGRWIGTNTDGTGFIASLKEHVPDIGGISTLIIGAGGAARAIYRALLEEGAKRIDVANRHPDRAAWMVERLNGGRAESRVMTLEDCERRLSGYGLVVQTTPVGMAPLDGRAPVSLRHLSDKALVIDIIYHPKETVFLREARRMGAKTANGLPMLLHQAAFAFQKWFGHLPDIAPVREKIDQILEERSC